MPFLSQEHRQQVLTAVERAKQITMAELNAVIEVSNRFTSQKKFSMSNRKVIKAIIF